ncbi:MAG: acetyl-CoA C-acyltransferase [Candidatus Cloacimonetes bacterium]|nr:acetyl-CoA C-acyltransferase [Candidatus Cloacimonadota bacterium]
MSRQAYIVDAVRTPVGRHGGALARVRPDDLAAIPLRALVARTGIDPAAIEDVILGCANQAGEDNRNVARMASLLAGYPIEVAGQTINRLCGSGLQAVNSAQQAIAAEAGDVFVAGGVESMSRAPYVMLKPEEGFARGTPAVADTVLGWRFPNPAFPPNYTIALGETAEVVAERCGVTREAQDEFALRSQQKAAAAMESCRFADELTPVEIAQRRGDPILVDRDEHPRPDTTLEALAKLRPVFRKDGTVTAGNSSGLNDGAAALLVVSEGTTRSLGLEPRARIVATAVAGVEPDEMGLGPVPATRKALKRAGLRAADLKLVEINEAFAAQSIPCMQQLDLDPEIVNVNGGAIALGHPLGASGARILTTLVHELRRRGGGYGVATMCIGVGQGIATVVEVY